MELQNPDKKTLRESNLAASDCELQDMAGLKCDETMAEEEEAGVLAQGGGGEKVKRINVSGGNISLVVDFSGALNGVCSSHNVSKSNESLVKANQTQEELLVGNLVWATTKSNKWWPAEVVGFKADANDSFMVRLLGESQGVSWCAPSKLKPFKESFEDVVNQRNDMGFFLALEKAMTLLRNSLKLEMSCSCTASENGIVTSPRYGKTRKTKPLILREFSVDRLQPEEFVAQLKNLAKCVSAAGILETTVLQSRLSVFYSFFGHKQLPMDQLHQNEGRKSFFTAAKMEDSQFVGSPSVVSGSSRRKFRKEWFRKFVSEVDNVSAREDLVNMPPSDLLHKLKLLAVGHKCSEETGNIGLSEWFFSKFRISVFRDENAYKMQLANMASMKDLVVAKTKTSKSKKLGKSMIEPYSVVSVADIEQKTVELQISDKSKIEVFSGVSVADTTEHKTFVSKEKEKSNMETLNGVATPDNEQKTSTPNNSGKNNIRQSIGHSYPPTSVGSEPFRKDFQEKSSVQSPQGKASMADTLSRPSATLVPDLNTVGNAFGFVEFNHLHRPETSVPPSVVPQKEQTPRSMILNFQAAAPCSTYGTPGTGFVPSQSADLFTTGKKKRGRKRKNAEDMPLVAHATNGIPDLNGTTTEAAQVEPTQRRRRQKKEESPRGLTRGITILFLKFSSQASMPSRDDLTSTFSAFGPLDSSETHVSVEHSGAEVAFVCSGDAIEAVKSLEKANPFGETLVSFRLQQKLITVQKNIAPRMPMISQVSPVPKLNSTPTSVDSMRQNLMMMTAMLEKSGDSLSKETKAKLKSEITGLLEKISSMPSSSSSS